MITKIKETRGFDRTFPIEAVRRSTGEDGIAVELLHWHEYVELLYAEGGPLEVRVNDEPKTLGQGEFAFINNTQAHLFTASEPNCDVISLYIPFDFLRDDWGAVKYIYPLYLKKAFIEPFIYDESCFELLKSACSEYFAREDGYELAVKADVLALFRLLLKRHADISERFKSGPVRAYDDILRSVNYIEDNYSDRELIEKLPAVAGLERSYFAKKFKRVTGMTPADYIGRTRLKKANELLLFTELPVSEISENVGFDTPNYFISRYHEQYGKTPLGMRNSRK